MFEYLEPDADGASNHPPAQPSSTHPQPEKLRHLLYGSRASIHRTIKLLHTYGYADPNDWSDPIPVPPTSSGGGGTPQGTTWMAVLTKTLWLE